MGNEEGQKIGNRMRIDPATGRIKVIPETAAEAQEKQRAGWDKRAEMWAETGGVQPDDQVIVEQFLTTGVFPKVDADTQILDLAVGAKSRLPEELVAKTVAVDLSAEMLMQNQSEVPKVAAAAEALPFPDASFSGVLNTFMMRYLTLDGQIAAVREMIRVTRPGGVICVIDFTEIGYRLEKSPFSPHQLQEILQRMFQVLGKQITMEIKQLKDFRKEQKGSPGDMYAFILTVN